VDLRKAIALTEGQCELPQSELKNRMWSVESWRSDDHIILSAYILIPLTLSVLSLYLSYAAEVSTWSKLGLPVSSVPILVGLVVSAVVNITGGYSSSDSSFRMDNIGLSDSVFYFSLLPPIIFTSAFALKRKDLVRHSDAAFLLAFAGSVISLLFCAIVLHWCTTSFLNLQISFIELVSFAALISSVDPVSALAVFSKLRVDPNLYNLVLGESLYNDAICVTVFRSASKYTGINSLSLAAIAKTIAVEFVATVVLSTILGYLLGAIAALHFKYCMPEQKNTHDRLVSIAILLCMVYLPFLAAEALELSGIVSVVAAAIVLRRYTAKNLSTSARDSASFVFSLISHMAETASLLLLGLSVFSQRYSNYHWGFVVCSILALVGGRILLTYPLLGLCNILRYRRLMQLSPAPGKDDKGKGVTRVNVDEQDGDGVLIKTRTMHLVAFSGLLRGAVSFSCAQIFPNTLGNSGLIVSTTTVIILASTFLVGGAVESLIRLFGIPVRLKRRRAPSKRDHTTTNTHQDLDCEGKCLYPILVRSQSAARRKERGDPLAKGAQDVYTYASDLEEHSTYSLSHASAISADQSELEDELESEDDLDFHTPTRDWGEYGEYDRV
jgi:NhaP-type Na+/H+ or K+/H+ antiporter